MNTINELRYVDNRVRAINKEARDKGDKYLLRVKTIKKIRYDKNNTNNRIENINKNPTEEETDDFFKRVKYRKARIKYTADGEEIEYYSDSSSNSSQDNQKSISQLEKIFQRRRLQYVSALNSGKIKRVNVSKLYEYGIVFNEASGKYERQNPICPRDDPVNKLIKDNEDIWTEKFRPDIIIQNAIDDKIKKNPELKNLSKKCLFTTGFNPESILLTAIALKRNKMKNKNKKDKQEAEC
jgi:hypothetical protein